MKIDVAELRTLATQMEIPLRQVIEPIQEALLIAYLRSVGAIDEAPMPGARLRREIDGNPVRVHLDAEAGTVSVLIAERNEAGEIIGEADVTPADFDRVAAATTRKVLSDSLRKVTDGAQAVELETLVGTMVSGVVQQGSDPRMVFVDLGRIEAVMPPAEQVPTEKYRHGERIKVILVAVRQLDKGLVVTVSRTHPALVRALFALEVPEVADGTVEIVALSREAGSRSKMAVISHKPQVAAKGSCIGPMGARVNAVVTELNGEKSTSLISRRTPRHFWRPRWHLHEPCGSTSWMRPIASLASLCPTTSSAWPSERKARMRGWPPV